MDFYKRIELVVNHIPYGTAATYGQIALLCGMPKNARQVGYALGHRYEVSGSKLPAHRVVNAQGRLSGAMSFGAWDTQKKLLEAEGIEVDEGMRVDLKRFGWRNTLDDALWFRASFEKYGI